MIDDDVVTRILALHDHIQPPPTPVGADAARGERLVRRRRAVVVAAVAAVVVAVLGATVVTTGGMRAGGRIEPVQPHPTRSADRTSTFERIRAEGQLTHERVTPSGMTLRTYVLCDVNLGCSPDADGPTRRQHERSAVEVSQDGRAALFRIADSDMTVLVPYDDASVLVMDPQSADGDALDPAQNKYRLVRADGTEIGLRFDPRPAPAVPGPGDLLVNHYGIDPDTDSMESQTVVVVDEGAGTVRRLDPQGLDMRRTWGPNLDQSLWFVTFDCNVYFWTAHGTFETSHPGCTSGFDAGHFLTDAAGDQTDLYGNPGWGDITWVNGDWFPAGWLVPGRMAFLERNFLGHGDARLTLHVTLDEGATWQQIPVSDEAAIPDTLRRLG